MPFFIDGRVIFRVFTFYIVFDETWSTWRVFSIIAENRPHAHHRTHLLTTKAYVVYIASPSKVAYFFDHWSIHLFQSNQRFQAIKLVDRLVPEKFTSFALISHKLFHAWLSSRRDTYPQFPRSPLGTPGTMMTIWHRHTIKKRLRFRVSLC